eukprot:gene4345-4924_t
MADNDFSSTVKHAFVKIESKRRRERKSTDRYIERRTSLQTCCDEKGFKTAAADMLNSRQRLRKSKPDRHTEYMDDDQSPSSNLIDDKIKLANKDKKEDTEENEDEDDAMQDLVSIESEVEDIEEVQDEVVGTTISNSNIDLDLGAGEVAAKRSISLVASYVYELKSFEGICPVNPNYTAFCILDIDTDKHTLNERKFVVVTRKAIRFGGNTWKWVYGCSKCKHSADLLRMSTEIHLSYEGFQKLQNPCHHCLAAVEVLTEFDTVNDLYPSSYIDAEVETEIHCPVYPIPRNQNFIVVWDSCKDTHGIVTRSRSGPVCRSCTTPTSCSHLEVLVQHKNCEALPVIAHSILNEISTPESLAQFKCLSSLKIPFHGAQCGNLELKLIAKGHGFVLRDGIRACNTCKIVMESSMKDPVPVKLYMQLGVFEAQGEKCNVIFVFENNCRNCNKSIDYDGSDDGFINMGNFIVSHTLLRNFMHHFLHGRMPMFTYYTVYCTDMTEMGFNISQFSYNKFKDTWYAFLGLLDINFQNGFSCNICQDHPRMCIMDATSLSFRKEMVMAWNCFLARNKTINQEIIPRVRERIYVPDKRCRELLERYTLGRNRKGRTSPLDYASFDELRVLLRCHHDELYRLFITVHESVILQEDYTQIDPSVFVCPRIWRPLFSGVSSATPVCGLLHSDISLRLVVDRVAENIAKCQVQDESDMLVVKNGFPLLYDLIVSFPEWKPPLELSPVLKKLLLLSVAPFKTPSALPSSINTVQNPYGYWPALPLLRERGSYEVEKKKKDDGAKFVMGLK